MMTDKFLPLPTFEAEIINESKGTYLSAKFH